MKKEYIDREDFLNSHFKRCSKCGYLNRKEAIAKWGTCICCKNVIDEKAKLKYELFKRRVYLCR